MTLNSRLSKTDVRLAKETAMEMDVSQIADQVAGLLWIHFWQLTIVMLMVWGAVRIVARNRPHLAHVLWLLVVLKAITPPVVAAKVGLFPWIQATQMVSFSADPQSPDGPASELSTHSGIRDNDLAKPRFAINAQEATHPPAAPTTPERVANSTSQSKDHSIPATHPTLAMLMDPTITILLLWCAGAIACFGSIVFRVWRAILRMKSSRQSIPPELQQRFEQHARNAGVRARLWMTSSNYGPVAFGVLWPTIAIPNAIARAKPADHRFNELDAIFSHELAHLRRRDLLIGWLQVIAQSIWWFHPLMWIANRKLSQESEKCCDEEAVGRLGCDAAEYVRGLLNVLDVKRSLRAVPVLPGIRQLDITKKRLERIVKQKRSFRTKSPVWCGALLVVAAAACLPGIAATVDVQAPLDGTNTFTLRRSIGPIDARTPRQQIELSVDLISGPADSVEKLFSDWKIKASEQDASSTATVALGQAIRRDAPVLWKSVREADYHKIRGAALREPRVHVTSSVETVRATQTLHLSDVVHHPFVVGLEAEPVISTVDSGLAVGLTPDLVGEDDIRIHFKVALAKILDVERLTVKRTGQSTFSVQVPKVATSNSEARLTVRSSDTLLVGGIRLLNSDDTEIGNEDQSFGEVIVIAVRATIKPDFDESRADGIQGLERPITPISSSSADNRTANSDMSVLSAAVRDNVDLSISIVGEPWDLTKAECLKLALHQSKAARSIFQFRDSPDGDSVEAVLLRADFTIFDAEITLRNLISEVEKTYWELVFFYRNLDAAKVGRDNALLTWRSVKERHEDDDEKLDANSVAQSQEQYFFFRSRVEEAKRDLVKAERALRYVCGIPVDDGRLIRPVEKPNLAKVQYDWDSLKQRTLRDAPEIRRARHSIESFKGQGRVFLPGYLDDELGDRTERARVRNNQLQLARATAILEDTELELTHSLTDAVQNVDSSYQLANTAAMQELSAAKQAETLRGQFEKGKVTLDFLLDAQRRHADACIAYHRSLTQFEMAKVEVAFRTASLAPDRNINLSPRSIEK